MRKMRSLLDEIRAEHREFNVLSMGMSGDYALCVKNGSNAVRIGTGIFGERRSRIVSFEENANEGR